MNCKNNELTVLFIFSWENTIEFEDNAHVAVDIVLPLRRALQFDTDVMEKAEVKESDTSKFVVNEVMALRRMEYCELDEAAVLGEAEAEATVKLSCECTEWMNRRMMTIMVAFL